jgi:hypothetical protein
MNKDIIVLLLLITICPAVIFCTGVIEEADVPMPEVIYVLPESLIGEFVLSTLGGDYELTVFSNNKYILHFPYPSHQQESFHCGHVIKRDNTYFFLPIIQLPSGSRISTGNMKLDGTEIYFDNSTFSYYMETMLLTAIRKEDIPVPGETLANDVTIPMRNSKGQYFISGSNGKTIDFIEVRLHRGSYVSSYGGYYHVLQIVNGIVTITRTPGPQFAFQDMKWDGFLEETESGPDTLKGAIRFTNGNSYYYIKDGNAFLEQSAGMIRITMPCTNAVEEEVLKTDPDMLAPIYFILEF